MKTEEIKLAFNTNIQFAISDDLKSSVSILSSASAEVNKAVDGYESAYKVMQSEISKAKSVLSNQTKLISVADTKAKEIGVSPSTIPGYSEANKAWSATNSVIDKASQF